MAIQSKNPLPSLFLFHPWESVQIRGSTLDAEEPTDEIPITTVKSR